MKTLIVGCGGFGVNRAAAVAMSGAVENVEVLPNVDFLMIDGSDSNFAGMEALQEKLWKVDGTDGAGKIRGNCAEVYVDFIRKNVAKVPEADMYVVVYSLSGGSGSVLGPELVHQLMAKGKNCVNVVLSTDDSKVDVKNTFNTLTGLANYAEELGRPIHFMLEESSSGTRSEVDAAIHDHIVSIAGVCGRPHHGLDSNDVSSWLDYHKFDVPAGLTMIERFDDAEILRELDGSVITILSLLNDSDNVVPQVGAVFNTDGICEGHDDVHFITTTKNMDNLCRKISDKHQHYQSVSEGLNTKKVFGTADGAKTGMVY